MAPKMLQGAPRMDPLLSNGGTTPYHISELISILKAARIMRTGKDHPTTIELALQNQEEDLIRMRKSSVELLALVADPATSGTTAALMSSSTIPPHLHPSPYPCPWRHPKYVLS